MPKDAIILAMTLECNFGDCSEQVQIGVPYYTIEPMVKAMQARFHRLYQRRAMLHHYAQFEGGEGGDVRSLFADAEHCLSELIEGYRAVETAPTPTDAQLSRLVPFC